MLFTVFGEERKIKNFELRKIAPSFVISLCLIRFWIEVVTTTILKHSNVINKINKNQIGFHHWQLGLVIILVAFVLGKWFPKSNRYAIPSLGFGSALFLDQYTYILSQLGVRLPFTYRSQTDYSIIGLLIIGAILFWKFSEKKTSS